MTETADLDMTMMLAFHAGFRRDADRLLQACEQGTLHRPSVRAGFEDFTHELEIHHHAEDDDLWPVARRNAKGNADQLATLDAMVEEHAAIDPLIAAVNRVLADDSADAAAAAEAVANFRDCVLGHLRHEESETLPLLDRLLSPAEWKAFSETQRKKNGIKGAKHVFPWLADGNVAECVAGVELLPKPLQLINRTFWMKSYAKTARW